MKATQTAMATSCCLPLHFRVLAPTRLHKRQTKKKKIYSPEKPDGVAAAVTFVPLAR